MKLFSFFLLLGSSFSAVAQTFSDTTQLNEVVIVENRFQFGLKNSSQNITSINAGDINALPVRSFAEALSYVPGVDIRQRGPFGAQADIGLRGGSFEQTLLLVNGMKLSDPQTGHHTMNLPLPFFSVQQIDVLKGPAARIYGQNAFAGAVNIITSLPATACIKAQVYTGDFSLLGANIFLAGTRKKFSHALSASANQNGNYNYNSDTKQGSVLYETRFSVNARHNIRTLLAASTRSMGANGFYSDKYPDQWESTSTFLAGISYNFTGKRSNFQVKNYYRLNTDEFRLKRHLPAFYTNTHRSQVGALEGNGSFKSKLGLTGYGVDLRREQINSSNLGQHQRSIYGMYFEHRVQLAALTLRAGVYGNYYNKVGFRYFPGAELGYQIKKRHFIYSNWGYSFRIPTYTELYYKDPVTTSNPNLQPEQAQSIELGYRFRSGAFFGEASIFNRATQNLIDYLKPAIQVGAEPTVWTPSNFTKVNFTGIEVMMQYSVLLGDSTLGLTAIKASYNFIRADIHVNESQLSRYSLNQLRQQAIAGLQFLILKRITLTVSSRYIQKHDLSRYLIFDAKAGYKIRQQLELFAECSNISNQNYIETGFVQVPGRWFRAGLTFNY